MSDETAALRKKLLKLDKNELARKCKKKSLAANGTKMDMVDRLIEYNEKNGGVTGAREGSKKNTNTEGDEGEEGRSRKKKKKSGGRGGGGGRSGGGGGGARSNTRSGGGGGGGECNCNGTGGSGQNATIAGVLSIICLILYIVALAVDELSHDEIFGIDTRCGWKRVCVESRCSDAFEDACDFCDDLHLDTEACDDACSSWSGGQAWLSLNIIGLILCFFGVLGMYSDQIQFQCSGQLRSKAFILFISSAICAILAIIIFVATNDYFGGCYGDGTDFDLGASNIMDIIIGIVLCIVAFLAY